MPQPPNRLSDASRRPSLLAAGAPKARPVIEEPSGFGVSILSAARDDFRPSALRSAGPQPQALARRGTLLWLLGTALAAAGLIGLAQWQRSPAPAALQLPAPAAVASAPTLPTATVAEPLVPKAIALAPEEAGLPSGQEPPGASLRSLAERPSAAKPAARAPSPEKRLPTDPDTELVAAVMAHTDAGRRSAPQALSELQRLHFSGELRKCRSGASVTARDACVVAACEARGYWGRTKSCPLPPAPPKAVADGKPRATKPTPLGAPGRV